MDAMKETAKEIRATNKLRAKEGKLKAAAGQLIRQALTIEERFELGVDVDGATFDLSLNILRQLAKERREAKRISAEQRMPLIGERYQKVLARGIAHLLKVTDATPRTIGQLSDGGPEWASITKAVLHTAYMTGSIPALTMFEAHPGSRSGVFLVDLRDLTHFAMRDGNTVTPASILARVQGKAKP